MSITPMRRIRERLDRVDATQAGYSLIEVLVACTLLLVVMAAVYGIWFGLQDTYVFAKDDMQAQEQARTALGEMVEYIRTARLPESPPDQALNAVIPVAQRNTLMVWTDTDRDANHDLELVRFRVDGDENVLYRDEAAISGGTVTWESHRLVSPNVSNGLNPSDATDDSHWLFTYHDGSGGELPFADGTYSPWDDASSDSQWNEVIDDPTQIREVHIKLLVDIYADQAPVTHELSSVVQPRNLRQY